MKTLNDIKKHKAVKFVSDERTNGDGIWIYLHGDYWNSEMDCRIIHEQTLNEVIKKFDGIKKL